MQDVAYRGEAQGRTVGLATAQASEHTPIRQRLSHTVQALREMLDRLEGFEGRLNGEDQHPAPANKPAESSDPRYAVFGSRLEDQLNQIEQLIVAIHTFHERIARRF